MLATDAHRTQSKSRQYSPIQRPNPDKNIMYESGPVQSSPAKSGPVVFSQSRFTT